MIAQSIVGFSPGRPAIDFYPTPPEATLALINNYCFSNFIPVWEPACGDGAISKVLTAAGFDVISTDLVDYGFGTSGIDFLETIKILSSVIITNPPYRLAEDFIRHAIDLGAGKLALLLKLSFLEGQRRKLLFEQHPPEVVLVFSRRLTMTRNGAPMRHGGMIAFAWYVWSYGFSGEPKIKWI